MAGDAIPTTNDKPYGITNIKTYIPLVLDLDELNYDSWSELFTLHCRSFGVLQFIDGTSTSADQANDEWAKLDSLVKLWIFSTISKPLLQRVLKKNITAHDVWKQLKDVFHDNKTARAMQLDNDLRTIELGSMSITEYFHKIRRIADLLANIDAPVDEANLVTYAINGLGDRFDQVAGIIRHRETTPTFAQTQSMLLLEESRLARKSSHHSARDTSSSGSYLLVSPNDTRSAGARSGGNTSRVSAQQWGQIVTSNGTGNNHGVRFVAKINPNSRMGYVPNRPAPSNVPPTAFGPTGVQGVATHSGPNWGPYVVYGPYEDQVTTLPQAFNTMTFQDFGDANWYMDTGATSHLASDVEDSTSPISLRLLTTPSVTSPPNNNNIAPTGTNIPGPSTPMATSSPTHTTLPSAQPTTPTSQTTSALPIQAQLEPNSTLTDHTQQPQQPATTTHPIVTRLKVSTVKPNPKFACHVTTPSPLPRSHLYALCDPNWQHAMQDEFNALITNGTWVLVPRPPNVNVVHSMWLFKHKFHADGSLSRYKACLIANGRSQQQGIDCDETFNLVVKPATIRTILSLAVSRACPIHQLDVKNAILHGNLSEIVYMHQPTGFTDHAHPDYVCLLQKSLYGLKQAPRAWFQRFASYAIRVGFRHSRTDSSLFIYHRGSETAYLLLYVDDIILTASSSTLLQHLISSLHTTYHPNGEISLQADRGNGVMCLTMSCKAVRQARYMRSTCADGNSVFLRSQVVKSVFYGIDNLLLMLEETQNYGKYKVLTASKRKVTWDTRISDHNISSSEGFWCFILLAQLTLLEVEDAIHMLLGKNFLVRYDRVAKPILFGKKKLLASPVHLQTYPVTSYSVNSDFFQFE
ncbi:ribonuclease H-like domain-containing protein [Tanacetum coccineum]